MLQSAGCTAYCVASDVPEAKASALADSKVMIARFPRLDVSCCFSSSDDGSVQSYKHSYVAWARPYALKMEAALTVIIICEYPAVSLPGAMKLMCSLICTPSFSDMHHLGS